MSFHEYPKAMHGPNDATATVNSVEEEKALGDGWIDGHAYWALLSDTPEGDAPKKRGRKKKEE